MSRKLPEILDTYTQVIAAIQSCETLQSLQNCDQMLTSFIAFNDNSDLQVFVSKADAFYKKKFDKLNAENVKEVLADNDSAYEYLDDQPTDSINH
jgi:hypothetical protein